jgi:O-methyltransferase involved in polyketide biosynthesis
VEGLTIYLTREDVAALFARLAALATTGSRLAVSFESGFERQPITRRLTRIYDGRAGEPLRFRLRAEDAPSFLAEAGWTTTTLLTDSDREGAPQRDEAGRQTRHLVVRGRREEIGPPS